MNIDDDDPGPEPPRMWRPAGREFPQMRPPIWLTPRVVRGALVGLAAVVLLSSIAYQVQLEEVGVVLRFGRFVRTAEPGLHVKLPLIESVLKVPVQRQLKEEFGFRTTEPAVRTRYAAAPFEEESVMLTGDLNVAIVEWIVQYRVTDPYKYLFRVRNVTETFRSMNQAVMREVVGDRTVTEVLTVGRQEIATTAEQLMQEMANQYEMGIVIDQIVLQDVTPPDPVKPSWDEVNQAQQQRDRLINEARAEYNKVVPRARGEAVQAILPAEGYGVERVNTSQGDAARFKALHEAYRRAPDVTRRRLHLETMQRVLPQLGAKVFMDKGTGSIMPLLPIEGLKALVGEGGQQAGGQK
ncbi:MAG TPA: FtsH protease activity modulator HflK [Vicinamibacterales bacterium]|nr:FtsH protease activity modulator HflK [Vicinamibacterales bacterium]